MKVCSEWQVFALSYLGPDQSSFLASHASSRSHKTNVSLVELPEVELQLNSRTTLSDRPHPIGSLLLEVI